MQEAGHTFLARMGKKRLRPGGKRATEWLLKKGNITASTKILEVACNMGTTSIGLARRFGCKITACDLDRDALSQARKAVKLAALEDMVTLVHADATSLPFGDNSFDIVINEAMLTMLRGDNKKKAVREYLRVLKPGGILLTHDVAVVEESVDTQQQIIQELSRAIHLYVEPLTEKGWCSLFQSAGFSTTDVSIGKMTLMSPQGMIYDEGLAGAFGVLKNARKPENWKMFSGMKDVFTKRKHQLGYIAFASQK